MPWLEGRLYSFLLSYDEDFFIHACIYDPLINESWDALFIYASSVNECHLAQF